MKIVSKIIGMLIVGSLLWSSCQPNNTPQNSGQGLASSFGKINEVVLVCDSTMLQSRVGDTLTYYFQAPYIILPQPEPLYDFVYYTAEEIIENEIRRQYKNYIFLADLSDESSRTNQLIKRDIGPERLREVQEGKGYTVTVGRNKWAYGQLLIYIVGYGKENLIKNIQENFPLMAKKINDEQLHRIDATAYQGGENESLERELKTKMGVKLKVPKEYFKAIYDDETNTMWMRRETRKLSANIIVHKIPYTNEEQLSREGLKEIRDKLGRKYVSTTIENTYMRTNDQDLPMFVEQKSINDFYALEARGIWDIVNDYMGGPFISYLIHNPTTNELLFVDGFVHAPGERKRNAMQEMEHVLASVEF